MRIVLCDDECLSLRVEGVEMRAFCRSATWKLRMPSVRLSVERVEGQTIWLRTDLSVQERTRVVDELGRLAPQTFELVRVQAQGGHDERAGAAMAQKARVGLAIRSRSQELLPQVEEFRRVVDSVFVRLLRDQQLWDAFQLCTLGSAANFSVPGSGKTATTLAVFAFLRARGLVRRVLVVCPLSAFDAWRGEWASCFGSDAPLRCLSFHDEQFARMSLAARRKELRYNAARYDLILLNYEALGGYVAEAGDVVGDHTLLVCDEVHKVKRIGGQWATATLEVARSAERVVALTGTPIPNSYLDLYNLLHILYPHDYDAYFGYSPSALAAPSPQDVSQINRALQPFFCRTDKRSLGVPQPCQDHIVTVQATNEEQGLFEALVHTYGNESLSLVVRLLQLESDPAMLGEEVLPDELEGMFDEAESGRGIAGAEPAVSRVVGVSALVTAKTSACVRLVRGLVSEGKQVIVWCFFRQSMRNLQGRLTTAGCAVGVVNGQTGREGRASVLEDFRAGAVQVLVTNPHTLGESVSLHTTCHDAVYFEYGYNLVHLLQSKDRIHRLGLPPGQYTQYHFMQTFFAVRTGTWSLDANIYARLSEKERVMLEAIDQGVLEVGATDEHDLELVLGDLFSVQSVN